MSKGIKSDQVTTSEERMAVAEAISAAEEAKKMSDVAVAVAEKKMRDTSAAAKEAAFKAAGPKTEDDDVSVICLKSAPIVRIGHRVYSFKQGELISMHPSHAKVNEDKGWVVVKG